MFYRRLLPQVTLTLIAGCTEEPNTDEANEKLDLFMEDAKNGNKAEI